MSQRPGIRNLPVASRTHAPAGVATVPVSPIATMRPEAIATVRSGQDAGPASRTLTTVTCSSTSGLGAPAAGTAVAPSRRTTSAARTILMAVSGAGARTAGTDPPRPRSDAQDDLPRPG